MVASARRGAAAGRVMRQEPSGQPVPLLRCGVGHPSVNIISMAPPSVVRRSSRGDGSIHIGEHDRSGIRSAGRSSPVGSASSSPSSTPTALRRPAMSRSPTCCSPAVVFRRAATAVEPREEVAAAGRGVVREPEPAVGVALHQRHLGAFQVHLGRETHGSSTGREGGQQSSNLVWLALWAEVQTPRPPSSVLRHPHRAPCAM